MINEDCNNLRNRRRKFMDIVTVIKVVGTILTVVATSIEATNKK